MRKVYGLSVLAIRRGDETLTFETGGVRDMPFKPGDTLVVHTTWVDLARLEKDRDFVVVTTEYPHEELRPHKVPMALLFFAITLGLVLFTDLMLSVALLTGAVGMILTGVLSIDADAKRLAGMRPARKPRGRPRCPCAWRWPSAPGPWRRRWRCSSARRRSRVPWPPRRRGGADAGVDQDRHLGVLDDGEDVERVADAEPGADGRGQRHHGAAADVFQLLGDDRVVVGVDHHVEAVGDQHLGGLDGLRSRPGTGSSGRRAPPA
jgi:hypothetical protein